MEQLLNILKGTHPGRYVERELKKAKRSKGEFALTVREYPQTLSAIINGKRSMNTPLALRIEQELALDEGLLMILQVYYDIEQEKKKQRQNDHPDLLLFRPALFWDTKIDGIDWDKQKDVIISRVFERGNLTEKKEIRRYYGHQTIRQVLSKP